DQADRTPKSSDTYVDRIQNIIQIQAIRFIERPFQHWFGNLKSNQVMIAIGGITVLGDLCDVKTELNPDVGFGIILVGHFFSIPGSQLWEGERYRAIDVRVARVIRTVMSQRSQGEGVLIQI